MQIDTRAIEFALTEPIRVHAEALAVSALGPFADIVQRVTVRLQDVNASRGGIDKRCRIVAAIRGRVLVAQAIHSDLYVAIDNAAKRIRRMIARTAKRPLGRERHGSQRPGALPII